MKADLLFESDVQSLEAWSDIQSPLAERLGQVASDMIELCGEAGLLQARFRGPIELPLAFVRTLARSGGGEAEGWLRHQIELLSNSLADEHPKQRLRDGQTGRVQTLLFETLGELRILVHAFALIDPEAAAEIETRLDRGPLGSSKP